MRISLLVIIQLSLAVFACGFVHAQQVEDIGKESFNFLVGIWKVDGRESYELWKKSGDRGLVGCGYKVRDGLEKISENLEIRESEGKTHYFATVPDQNEGATVKFTLTGAKGNEFVFENPGHDFPKKIVYKKLSDTELIVLVSGDGKGFSVPMTKLPPSNDKAITICE